MIALEDIVQAAIAAPPDRREAALRVLRGQLPASEPLLTLAELAKRLGFCTATLRRWHVPGHGNYGENTRYRLGEVEAYLQSEAFERRKAALRAERQQARRRRPAPTPAEALRLAPSFVRLPQPQI